MEFLPDSGDNRREQRNHEQTTPAEPLTGLQGEGGFGRRQGRPNVAQLAEHFDVHGGDIHGRKYNRTEWAKTRDNLKF